VLSIDGYTFTKRLQAGAKGEVHLGVRDADGLAVVLKVLPDSETGRKLAQREFDALSAIAASGIPRPIALELDGSRPLLVLEAMSGSPIRSWIDAQRRPAQAILTVAIQLAERLAAVHDARWLHRDVTPRNVLVELETLDTSLIDFGLAVPLSTGWDRAAEGQRSRGLTGTLLFISPEQTGRMNRGCDFRSDLYSTGATLYYMATGQPPFPISDPLELIHAHIARRPVPPHDLRTEFPRVFSELILRLLEKEPEARYSTAHALLADLRKLAAETRERGSFPEDFVLGSADRRTQVGFSDRLFGRDAERDALLRGFERVAAGDGRALFLQGAPGSGKSSLVHEFHRRLEGRAGPLAVGACTPDRGTPYGPWVHILSSLTQQFLVEGDECIEARGERLRSTMGNLARCLIDLVPDFEFIVGAQAPLPPLGPRESQARLSLALRRFLSACSGRERPLVVCVDDLQWIDAASATLLADLICNTPLDLVLVVACRYEADELPNTATEVVRHVRARGEHPAWIALHPLSREDSAVMLGEALHVEPDDAADLAQWIERKTGNQPLVIKQFVEHLYYRGLLRYGEGRGFEWDPAEIAASPIPDDAVGFVTAKIDQIDAQVRHVLSIASCLPGPLDPYLIAEAAERPIADAQHAIDVLCEQGLLLVSDAGPRFAHERVRESAQSLLTLQERASHHHRIGLAMWHRTPPEQRATHAAAIADQLNSGVAHLQGDLRCELLRLNLVAARRALDAGAAAHATGYVDAARALLDPMDESEQPELSFELAILASDCAFQSRRFDAARELLEPLQQQNLSLLQRSQVAAKYMLVLSFSEPPSVCVQYLLDTLRSLGVRWPKRPSRFRVWLEIFSLHLRMRNKSPEAIFGPARQVDPRWLAPLLLLAPAGAALLRTDVHLVVLASSFALRRYLRHGYLGRPGFTLSAHAYLAYHVLKDAAYARHCRELIRHFNTQSPDPVYNLRAELLIHAALDPMLERRRPAVAPLAAIAEGALELGDLEFSSYARFLMEYFRTLAGDPVHVSEARLAELSTWVQRAGHSYPDVEASRQVLALLLERDPDLETHSREAHARLQSEGELPYVRTLWMLVLCVHKRFDLALGHSDALGEALYRVNPFVHVVDHLFYRGLACAALAHMHPRTRRARSRELRRIHRAVARWARHGPDFIHMSEMLAAERLRLRGRHQAALAALEHAARKARQSEFTHHAALAFERMADLHRGLRRETDAVAAEERARTLYQAWGAQSKLRAMDSQS